MPATIVVGTDSTYAGARPRASRPLVARELKIATELIPAAACAAAIAGAATMSSKPTDLQIEQAEALARVAHAASCVRSTRELYEITESELEATRAVLKEFEEEEKAALRVASDLGLPAALLSIVSGRTRATVHVRLHRLRKKEVVERRVAARRARAAAHPRCIANDPLTPEEK